MDMQLERIDNTKVKVLRICKGCNKRFRSMHGLRSWCTECRPPSSEKEKRKYREDKASVKSRANMRKNKTSIIGGVLGI
jgi:hypothetical protein